MKKILKIGLFVLMSCILLVTSVFSYTAIKNANAETTDTTHVVNFYGANNEDIIYSVNVPNGMTLNDLENNNLIKNSDFSSYSLEDIVVDTTRRIFADKWYIYSNTSVNSSLTNSQNGFIFDYNSFCVAYQVGFTSYSIGETLYLTSKVNGSIVRSSFTFPSTITTYLYFSPSFVKFSFAVWTNSSNNVCNFDFRMGTDISCEYINVGYQNLDYFNSDYIDKLYLNSGGVMNSGFVWSTYTNQYNPISYDTPITSDLNLYGYLNENKVTFFGADNKTPIYDLNVPYGKSLHDIQNNNFLNNSCFETLPSTNNSSTSNIFNNWYFTYVTSSLSDNGIIMTNNNSWQGLSYKFELNQLVDEYVFSFSGRLVSGVSNFGIYTRFYDSSGNSINTGLGLVTPLTEDFNTYRLVIDCPNDYSLLQINLWFISTSQSSVEIEWTNLTEQKNETDYFNIGYVNRLYKNSGGVIDSNFEWSQSSTSSSRFILDTPIKTDINLYGYSFKGTTTDYTGELTSDYGNLGNYAIDSIEFFEVQGSFIYHIVIDTFDIPEITFLSLRVSNFGNFPSSKVITCDSFYFNCDSLDFFNMFMYSENYYYDDLTSNYNPAFRVVSQDDLIRFVFSPSDGGRFHLWFSPLRFVPLSRDTFELLSNSNYMVSQRFYNNLSDAIDMKSDTNYTFDLVADYSLYNTDSACYKFLDYMFNNFPDYLGTSALVFSPDSLSYYNYDFGFIGFYTLNDGTKIYCDYNNHYYATCAFDHFLLLPDYVSVESFVSFSVIDFYFFVHRPVQRVDNTLVIYNFDYTNLLYGTNGISYQLQADGNLYNVNYTGSVPNKYFIYISNDVVINTIYDEYVHVYISFNNNVVYLNKINTNIYSCSMGFDFNFTYYVQPLVSSNGIYNYTFSKPGYSKMTFSLSPFYIPVLEMVENAFIFLVFYCPIISDVIEFLHFDMFFGGLINVLNIIIGSAIGQFVLACFAFIVFYSILKGLFPQIVSTGKGIYYDSQFSYNRKRKKEDKIKSKNDIKESNYKQKLELTKDKQRRKVN